MVSLSDACSGKYPTGSLTRGGLATRSKAEYGSTMSTDGPPFSELPSVKVMLGFTRERPACTFSETKYMLKFGSYCKPKFLAMALATLVGKIIRGTVESMNVRIGSERRAIEEPFEVVDVIDFRLTTRSRLMSEARENETLLGVNLSES